MLRSEYVDIGVILKLSQRYTTEQKFRILNAKVIPCAGTVYKKTFQHDKLRSFNPKIVKSCFAYSQSEDCIYCLQCSILLPRENYPKVNFINQGYSSWKQISDRTTRHLLKETHTKSEAVRTNLVNLIQKRDELSVLPSLLQKQLREKRSENTKVLSIIIDAVLYLSKQGLALRGSSGEGKNPGNFLALLETLSIENEIIKKHLKKPLKKNATMTSWKIQNELLDVIGREIILKDIIKDVNRSKFYTLIADEVTSTNEQFMSICIRYIIMIFFY